MISSLSLVAGSTGNFDGEVGGVGIISLVEILASSVPFIVSFLALDLAKSYVEIIPISLGENSSTK